MRDTADCFYKRVLKTAPQTVFSQKYSCVRLLSHPNRVGPG